MLHPVPNNGENVALHAPTVGGLLPLVWQRRPLPCALVVRYKGMAVVAEIRKQLPAVLLFCGVQRALNGRFHYGNGLLGLALVEQLQDDLLEFGIVQIGAHSLVPVERVELVSAARHHVPLEPQAAVAVKHTPFHG